MQQNRKRKINWGSAIGWLIFIFAIAGGPIYNLLRSVLGGVVTLPPNLVPLVLGGLVALSILVSVIRALGSSSRVGGDARLPTTVTPQSTNAPMPPFAGSARSMQMPDALPPAPRAFTMPTSSNDMRMPSTPRFEPIINPVILVLIILGVLVLVGAGLLLFIPNLI